jgi:uncharacterized membrane protein
MVKGEQSVMINRPVQDVFAWVAQNYAQNLPKWQTSVKELRQTSPGPIKVGTTLQQVREVNGKPTPMTAEITQYAPNQVIGWKSKGESTETSGNITFQSANGGTRVTLMVDVQVAGLGRLASPMISRVVNREAEDDLSRLKSLLER